MRITIDSFLKPENLADATKESPVEATVLDVSLILAADLGFPSDEDRYSIRVQLSDGMDYLWMPNKTSLRALVTSLGSESDAWATKKIKLYSLEQNVSGKMKKVIYCSV